MHGGRRGSQRTGDGAAAAAEQAIEGGTAAAGEEWTWVQCRRSGEGEERSRRDRLEADGKRRRALGVVRRGRKRARGLVWQRTERRAARARFHSAGLHHAILALFGRPWLHRCAPLPAARLPARARLRQSPPCSLCHHGHGPVGQVDHVHLFVVPAAPAVPKQPAPEITAQKARAANRAGAACALLDAALTHAMADFLTAAVVDSSKLPSTRTPNLTAIAPGLARWLSGLNFVPGTAYQHKLYARATLCSALVSTANERFAFGLTPCCARRHLPSTIMSAIDPFAAERRHQPCEPFCH
ncbi:hypothetical protein P153DRAFT_387802 [Dothidotthia symphoricarpi CBS 119687]|uniref:Uncharacterized protein n=1 Tax=Dothidotthia symphoricarpi CBS 119687 TaxID=1392245 RepID=A0A6A6A8V9_9PLEO|nr:uncharacterized protein P153DRAFT_387802 [Dothidotthia symphoricarpi CBS 119687]KAF2127257.1 hypothetical protein P153DRAFT_387802 [Dothidotthia symphoricarpi CBS 119687]